MRVDVDVAIVGSGFAGALMALALRSTGRTVVLVERGRHPRFAIGESSTPLANLLLEELADTYNLPQIRAFSKWGTWQRSHPHVAGGLKRGFTFYFHRPGEAFADDAEHSRQLMVAASPHDEIGDTHWYRPDFDHDLVREAGKRPAPISSRRDGDRSRSASTATRASLDGVRGTAKRIHIDASFLVDVIGPAWGFCAGAEAWRLPAALAAADAGPLHALLEERHAMGRHRSRAALPGSPEFRPALSAGRCGATSCISWRLDLDAPVQQRHHECGCGADGRRRVRRSGGPSVQLRGSG